MSNGSCERNRFYVEVVGSPSYQVFPTRVKYNSVINSFDAVTLEFPNDNGQGDKIISKNDTVNIYLDVETEHAFPAFYIREKIFTGHLESASSSASISSITLISNGNRVLDVEHSFTSDKIIGLMASGLIRLIAYEAGLASCVEGMDFIISDELSFKSLQDLLTLIVDIANGKNLDDRFQYVWKEKCGTLFVIKMPVDANSKTADLSFDKDATDEIFNVSSQDTEVPDYNFIKCQSTKDSTVLYSLSDYNKILIYGEKTKYVDAEFTDIFSCYLRCRAELYNYGFVRSTKFKTQRFNTLSIGRTCINLKNYNSSKNDNHIVTEITLENVTTISAFTKKMKFKDVIGKNPTSSKTVVGNTKSIAV